MIKDGYAQEVYIGSEGDIVTARKVARDAATRLGFGITDVTRIITAAAELARNAFRYAGSGTMRWQQVTSGGKVGLELIFEDHGPGIANIQEVMQEGFSTSKGLGMGLPGSKRLMDEMEIRSTPGEGTVVIVRKWRRP